MGRLATLALLFAAGCAAPPRPPPPAPPVADEHPAVIAAPREPVAATPLASPGATVASPPPAPAAAPAPTAAPAPAAAASAPARLAAARPGDLVGAWRLLAVVEDGEAADASSAAPVFLVVAADSTLTEIALERGEPPPRTAAQLRPRLTAESRDRWRLEGETMRVERQGGFAPEAWSVARVERAGTVGDARAEIGDLVRTLVGRGGRPGARQLMRRLPGTPGA